MTVIQKGAPPVVALPRRKPSLLKQALRYPNAIRIASVTGFMVFWEWAGRYADPLFMSYPSAVWDAAIVMAKSGELSEAIIASMGPFLSGLAISMVAGIIIGLLMGQFELLEYMLDPFVNALVAIPRVALVPLIILWFGLESQGKIVIIISIAVFPVIINTYAGVKDVRGSLLEIGRAYGATEMQTFTKIILPAAIPFVMVGMRLCVGYGIIAMIVAEFFTALRGLGGLIVHYSNNFATAKLFVPMFIVGIMGIGLTQLVLALEHWLAPWRVSERQRN